jgi:Asp-tRNA(Asn)/Glu-tRNA(Gln) amidotransferase A subunit family amidase
VDFQQDSLQTLAGAVRAKEVSARELTDLALSRIETLNPGLNAFVAVDPERARREAAAVDQIVAAGGDPGPLAGIPIGVKDLDDAAGYRTTHGSPLLADAPVAGADSPFVARLRAAGCVVVGKTNTSEFGWSANTTNALFGPTRNPYAPDHSPGGSSGGTAAAVAAGLVPLATGSDGGGSIRIPSSCCGLSGMKPSLGRIPAGGHEPPGWLDLSTKGPMARRMADVVTALAAVIGPEPTDLRSLPRPEAPWPSVLDDPHVPTKVAWCPTLGYAEVDEEVLAVCERAVSQFEALGAEVVVLDDLFERDPVDHWLRIVAVCTARTVAPLRDHPDWERVDPILRAVVDGSRSEPATGLVEAMDECHRLNLRLVELFHDVRLLVCPTVAGVPPALDLDGSGVINGEIDPNWVKLTYPFNLTRSPAATVTAGCSAGGLPIGLQIIGPQHADLVVLRSAAALEQALGLPDAPTPA